MSKIMLYAFVGMAVIHGLIHLMGLVAYWPLGEIAELPFRPRVQQECATSAQSG